MKNTFFLLMYFFLLIDPVCGSSQDKIQIHIQQNDIIASDKGFTLKLLLENKTDTAFILYNFKLFGRGTPDKALHKKENIGVGSELFMFDANKNWTRLEIDGKLDRLRFTSMINIKRDSINKIYAENIILLKAKEKLEIDFPVKLRQGFLKKGIYSLNLVYHSNTKNASEPMDSKMKEEARKCRAVGFYGYVESNLVRVKVVKIHPAQKLDDYLKSDW